MPEEKNTTKNASTGLAEKNTSYKLGILQLPYLGLYNLQPSSITLLETNIAMEKSTILMVFTRKDKIFMGHVGFREGTGFPFPAHHRGPLQVFGPRIFQLVIRNLADPSRGLVICEGGGRVGNEKNLWVV